MKVHVFIGAFKSRKEAIAYTAPYWEPEPDETVSDEEYTLWENNNPKWEMASDPNCALDGDFIETITDENKFDYLCGIIENPESVQHLKEELDKKVLILIFEKAFSSENVDVRSTSRIEYKGVFESTLK